LNINNKITPHETFDIHELLVAKTIAATKSAAMSSLVTDDELKSILEQDLLVTQAQIKELQNLIQHSVFTSIDM